jgi:hypothetical protein
MEGQTMFYKHQGERLNDTRRVVVENMAMVVTKATTTVVVMAVAAAERAMVGDGNVS